MADCPAHNEQMAKAFQGLESSISDLRNMVGLVTTFTEDFLAYSHAKIEGDRFLYSLSREEVELFDFAMVDLERRIKELWEQYYAGFPPGSEREAA